MTTIKATCPECGEVDLTAEDIILTIGTQQDTNSYGFSCPSCSQFVKKPADERVVRLLLSGGVVPQIIQVPAEALERKAGPRINHDDLLAFHELMKTDNWFDQLTGSGTDFSG